MTPTIKKLNIALTILLTTIWLTGCSDSDSSGGNANSDSEQSSGGNPSIDNDTGTGTDTDTDNGGSDNSDNGTTADNDAITDPQPGATPTPDNNLDSLSHSGTPLPRRSVNPVGTAFYSSTGSAQLAAITSNPAVVYEVVENHGGDAFAGSSDNCSTLGAAFSSCSVTNLHIKDNSGTLNNGNWRLYFHSIRRILRVDSDEFSVSFVNGDLNYIEPTDAFSGFNGAVKTIALVTEFSHLIESDFMPRYWLVDSAGQVSVIANTDEDTDESRYAAPIAGDNQRAFNGETIPLASAGSRYARNQLLDDILEDNPLSSAEIQARIIPKPANVVVGNGALNISGGFSFQGTDLSPGNISALQARQSQFMSTAASVPLSAVIDTSLAARSYTLTVNDSGIALAAADREALFHAAQSLLGLVRIGTGTIPYVTISDAPRFSWRGMHVDVARNFHSVATLRKLIDQMAAYKLNRLHLHLSDDEGWRLQIPSIPELTSIGARRQFQLDGNGNLTEASGLLPQLGSGPTASNQGSGFYTREQFVDLLRYAADREIQVIPELDMPAHARAAVVAMRARAVNLGNADDINVRLDDPADTSRYLTIQHYSDGILNPCLPGTYNFISTVIADVKAMYTEANVSLDVWHMGGDEANNVFTGGGFQDVNASNKVPWRGEIIRSEWDFPWERSPACASFIANTPGVNSRDDLQPYFVEQVAQLVADAGIETLYAYQDILDSQNASELATQNAGIGYWEMLATDNGYSNIDDYVSRGFEAVVSVPDFLYFDFPQEVDPQERGYYWATRFTDTRKVHGFAPENLAQNAETSTTREGNNWSATTGSAIGSYIGMQGQLWSETVRTPAQFDYMVFPRLLALAERAWHRASWELDPVPGRTFTGGTTTFVDQNERDTDFAHFAHALALKELPKLDAAGVAYRVPVPGAVSQGGLLLMNSALPGIPLEYSTNGSDYVSYTSPVSAARVQAVRARTPNGARVGRADTVD